MSKKMLHKNIGPVELLGELNKGPNGGTMVKDRHGSTIEASTVYLVELPKEDEQPAGTNPGAGGGN